MQKNSEASSLYYLGITVGLFFIIISPQFLSEGMFMDGTYYAAIARNLAEGIGSFWKPHLTDSVGPVFKDHPPLAFGLESIWFTVFGDQIWVERAYALFCYALSGLIIIGIWKNTSEKSVQSLYFIPLLLWITVPKMTWSVCNNLIENTMMVFVLAAIYSSILFTNHKNYFYLILSGTFIFLGVLTKGVVALFPFSFLFFYFLFNKAFHWLHYLKAGAVQVLGFLIPVLFVFFVLPEGIKAFSEYIEIQLIGSLNKEQTVDSRFFILRKSIEESLVMLILAAFTFWYAHKKKLSPESNNKYPLIILLTAYSGIIPIVVSLKQSTFYINASFPLTAIAIALFIAPRIKSLILHLDQHYLRWLKALSFSLFFIGLIAIFGQYNTLRRDKERLSDIKLILNNIPSHTQIFQSLDSHREWALHAYFYRYGHVSLFWNYPEKYPYMIRPKNSAEAIPLGYQIIPLETSTLDLFQNKDYSE